MSEKKFCVDCRHCQSVAGDKRCGRYPSFVTGVAVRECVFERVDGPERCGEDGKFFEPKRKPWWRFW